MRNVLSLLLLGLSVSACSIHPIPNDVTGDTTVDIAKKIRCEAKRAIELYDPQNKLARASIGYNFVFTITENNNASGSAIFALPFTHGIFTLGLGGGAERRRVGEREFLIVDYFEEARKEDCSVQATRANYRYPITGIIGLEEIVSTFMELNKRDLLEAPKEKTHSFTDTLEFTSTFRANGDPKIVLDPVRGQFRLAEAKASLSADRSDKHKVVIALELPKKTGRGGGAGAGRADGPDGGGGLSSKDRALYSLERQREIQNTRKILDIIRTVPTLP